MIGGYHSGAIHVQGDRVIDYENDDLSLMIPLFIDETEDAIYQYYESPKNFIPNNVIEFIDEVEFYKAFQGGLKYDECSARFIEARSIYESSVSRWSQPASNNGGYS